MTSVRCSRAGGRVRFLYKFWQMRARRSDGVGWRKRRRSAGLGEARTRRLGWGIPNWTAADCRGNGYQYQDRPRPSFGHFRPQVGRCLLYCGSLLRFACFCLESSLDGYFCDSNLPQSVATKPRRIAILMDLLDRVANGFDKCFSFVIARIYNSRP